MERDKSPKRRSKHDRKVFIVVYGIDYEGNEIKDVFDSWDLAQSYCENYVRVDNETPHRKASEHEWKAEEEAGHWKSSNESLVIEKMYVKGKAKEDSPVLAEVEEGKVRDESDNPDLSVIERALRLKERAFSIIYHRHLSKLEWAIDQSTLLDKFNYLLGHPVRIDGETYRGPAVITEKEWEQFVDLFVS
jgi:hypothetical protein